MDWIGLLLLFDWDDLIRGLLFYKDNYFLFIFASEKDRVS